MLLFVLEYFVSQHALIYFRVLLLNQLAVICFRVYRVN